MLLTPTPALVPAATSTRYCTPVCRPPTTTERMVASTDLLTWKRVSLAKHQIWQRQTHQTDFIVWLYITKSLNYSVWRSLGSPCTLVWCHSVGQKEEGPRIHWWMCCCGFPLSALSLAVEAHLVLMGHTGGGKKIKERKGKKERKNEITTHSLFWKTSVSCFIYFFFHMSKRDLSHSLPQFILIQQAKQHGFFYFLSQPGRWLLGVLHLSFLS